MRKSIRCYHLFFPGNSIWLKLLLYLVYPLFVIGLALGIRLLLGDILPAYLSLLLAGALVLTTEITVDFFFFGGIASKDTNRLEYMKTSAEVKNVWRKGLIVDAVRRFVTIAGILTGTFFLTDVSGQSVSHMNIWYIKALSSGYPNPLQASDGMRICYMVEVILLAGLLSTVAIGLARFFAQIWVNLLAVVLMYGAFEGLCLVLLRLEHMHAGLIALFFMLCLGAVLWNIRSGIQSLEKSYYDR